MPLHLCIQLMRNDTYLLKGKNLTEALKAVIECLDGIFRVTHELNTDELALVQAQEYIK